MGRVTLFTPGKFNKNDEYQTCKLVEYLRSYTSYHSIFWLPSDLDLGNCYSDKASYQFNNNIAQYPTIQF